MKYLTFFFPLPVFVGLVGGLNLSSSIQGGLSDARALPMSTYLLVIFLLINLTTIKYKIIHWVLFLIIIFFGAVSYIQFQNLSSLSLSFQLIGYILIYGVFREIGRRRCDVDVILKSLHNGCSFFSTISLLSYWWYGAPYFISPSFSIYNWFQYFAFMPTIALALNNNFSFRLVGDAFVALAISIISDNLTALAATIIIFLGFSYYELKNFVGRKQLMYTLLLSGGALVSLTSLFYGLYDTVSYFFLKVLRKITERGGIATGFFSDFHFLNILPIKFVEPRVNWHNLVLVVIDNFGVFFGMLLFFVIIQDIWSVLKRSDFRKSSASIFFILIFSSLMSSSLIHPYLMPIFAASIAFLKCAQDAVLIQRRAKMNGG